MAAKARLGEIRKSDEEKGLVQEPSKKSELDLNLPDDVVGQ